MHTRAFRARLFSESLMLSLFNRTLASGKGPDTLYCIGIPIIHEQGTSRCPVIHVGSGAFRAPYAKNLFPLCSLGAVPLGPPLH